MLLFVSVLRKINEKFSYEELLSTAKMLKKAGRNMIGSGEMKYRFSYEIPDEIHHGLATEKNNGSY